MSLPPAHRTLLQYLVCLLLIIIIFQLNKSLWQKTAVECILPLFNLFSLTAGRKIVHTLGFFKRVLQIVKELEAYLSNRIKERVSKNNM
jgi:hypothetical protein